MSALPARPDEITPRWLTEALSKSLPGVEVARVEVVDRHSGTTGRAKLRLDYAAGARGPETIFVKLPPFKEMQRRLVAATDMGRREARFYAELAAETPIRVPRCYFAAHGDQPTDYICERALVDPPRDARRLRREARASSSRATCRPCSKSCADCSPLITRASPISGTRAARR